jgi:hypothetical protein
VYVGWVSVEKVVDGLVYSDDSGYKVCVYKWYSRECRNMKEGRKGRGRSRIQVAGTMGYWDVHRTFPWTQHSPNRNHSVRCKTKNPSKKDENRDEWPVCGTCSQDNGWHV